MCHLQHNVSILHPLREEASQPTSNLVVTNWSSLHEGISLLHMKVLGVHMDSIGSIEFSHVYPIIY